MKILCVIPSRMSSTRLPRKPLAMIQGKPMIQRVYEAASSSPIMTKVIVATDHPEIASVVSKAGGDVMMTDPELKTGSERVAVVAEKYPDMDVVINLQGDEPFMRPKMLEQLVAPYLAGEKPEMTTLAYPLAIPEKYNSPDTVKVITDIHHNALYFSRSAIPYFRSTLRANLPVYNHMGLYAFRYDFLMLYRNLVQTPLDQVESLEQLRVLEHGYKIRVCFTEEKTLEINTPQELAEAQQFKL